MSSSLIARPAKPIEGLSLTYDIKIILRKRNGGTDNDPIHGLRLTEKDCDYINGLCDAGVKGSHPLLVYLNKHKEIILNEEY